MNPLAIVVTYNRLPMLRACVDALKNQTAPCDILIVDNDSWDGTEAWASQQAGLQYQNTGANLGGAGGFHFGVRWAAEQGYAYVWLMDDDCVPAPDALEKLMAARETLGNLGFLCSDVRWTDGSECRMNRPKLTKKQPALPAGIARVQQATFVSLLIPMSVIRRCGLPIREFFIWGDDIEFTRRLTVAHGIPGYLVRSSRVIHNTQTNCGSNIAVDREERIGRYFYAFRNECFLYRREGIWGWCCILAKNLWHSLRILILSPSRKWLRLAQIWRGFADGLRFSPQIEYLD